MFCMIADFVMYDYCLQLVKPRACIDCWTFSLGVCCDGLLAVAPAGGCNEILTLMMVIMMIMVVTLSSVDVDSKLKEWATLDIDFSSSDWLLVKDLHNVLFPRRSISVNWRLRCSAANIVRLGRPRPIMPAYIILSIIGLWKHQA